MTAPAESGRPTGPLSGIRVIDMTTVLMGPYASQMMGDMGADVIKVEAPEGDLIRQIGPARHDGMGPIYLNANRSKRAITLDLKRPEGRAALLRLCEGADVLVCNVRAKAMKRLGLAYEDVAAVNPRLVYAGMYGYGQDGPYAARPAYDDLIQGGAALPYLFSQVNDGKPRYVPSAIADRVVGLAAVGAILAAIIDRGRTGLGQKVEIPMFETMVSVVMGDHLGGLTFEPPLDGGGYRRHLSPGRRPYQTSDGYICALIYTDSHWQRFFAAIGRQEMPAADPRFQTFASRMANVNEVYDELSAILLTRTSADWIALLDEADIPVMPMHDLESLLRDPHLVETGFFQMADHPSEGRIRTMAVPSKWSRSAVGPSRHAPLQGEHSTEILREAGFTAEEIAALVAGGVVTCAPGAAV